MTTKVEGLINRVHDADADLKRHVQRHRQHLQYRIRRGRVWFDIEVREAHKRLRQSIPAYICGGKILSILTAPVIYSLALPLVLLDLWVTLYQWICFPIYGIARVPRRRYLVIDRHKLAYLNAIEKVHCNYCGYANGLIAYVREVAARTEQYWCPIKHARPVPSPHGRYHHFFDYGDADAYRGGLEPLRESLRPEHIDAHRPTHRDARSQEISLEQPAAADDTKRAADNGHDSFSAASKQAPAARRIS